MQNNIILCIAFFALSCNSMMGATVFNKDGIKLNYEVEKAKVVFIPALKQKVIIWKSNIELTNTNNKPVSVTAPCCLYYAFCFMFPSEISAVQNYVTDVNVSDLYKTYATQKPTMLNAKQTVSNERYFATYANVNLNSATYNLEVKYSF